MEHTGEFGVKSKYLTGKIQLWHEVRMGDEFIIFLVTAVFGVIAGAFGFGHMRDTNKAEAKVERQHT
ncbi:MULTISPECIES: hypothetical protein [unclassified Klebsiella]|uniref:hypothetical protein n=1 Tax=unclassified Klebsiella TaxID=2608929 RepID=UPI003FA397ED